MTYEDIYNTFETVLKEDLPKIKHELQIVAANIQTLSENIQNRNTIFSRLSQATNSTSSTLNEILTRIDEACGQVEKMYNRLFVVDDATMRAEIIEEMVHTLRTSFNIAPITIRAETSETPKHEPAPKQQTATATDTAPTRRITMTREDFEALGMGAVPDPSLMTEDK